MRQKTTNSTGSPELKTARMRWSQVCDEITDSYQHDPAYRAGYDRAARRHALAARIRELRQERGLSQRGLAELVSTSQAAIARLELGGAEPRLATLERIAAALGMRLVIGLEPQTKNASPRLSAAVGTVANRSR